MNELKNRLRHHPVFKSLRSAEDLRIFMEHHCVAVLDFMHIVKSIQNEICPSNDVWTPPKNRLAARLINEIVLAEESDRDSEGNYKSHFEMYVDAMQEISAQTEPIRRLVQQLRLGQDRISAVNDSAIPEASKAFAHCTISVLDRPLSDRIAVFFHTRENLIPDMFRTFIDGLQASGLHCPKLVYYLDRHIEIDGETHGPMAERLLEDHPPKSASEQQALVKEALTARCVLWTKIQNSLAQQDKRQQP